MQYFSIGFLSVALAAMMPLVYLAGYGIRRLGKWTQREPAPTDRVGFFVITAAVFGFLVGSFAQPSWDRINECRATGLSLIECTWSDIN